MGLVVALLCLFACPQDEQADAAAVRTQIGQLTADFLEERDQARAALERLGPKAEPWLIEALSHRDYRVRRACLELLAPLKSTAALPRAAELFAQDDDASVRDAAFRLFQSLGARAEDAMIRALASPIAEYRKGAIQTLLEIKSQKCAGRLVELCDQETDKSVREAAWKCLLALGPSAQPYLLKFLKDPDPQIRRDAVMGLRGSQQAETLAAVGQLFVDEGVAEPRDMASAFLTQAGLGSEPYFLSGLRSARPETVVGSLRGLAQVKSSKGLGPVSELFLKDAPKAVREAAADYLVSQGPAAEPVLLRALDLAAPDIRNQAILTLGQIGSEKALAPIARLFRESRDRDLHDRCFNFLRQLGKPAENELLGALDDEDRGIRRQAALALGEAKSEKAIPKLIDFLTELDTSMKEVCEAALASIGPGAIEQVGRSVAAGKLKKPVADAIESKYMEGEVERLLREQLGDNFSTGFYDNQFREVAALGVERVIPILARILNEPQLPLRYLKRGEDAEEYRAAIRELAVMAVGEIGGEGARGAVIAFTHDDIQNKRERVREETLVALYRLGDRPPLEEYLRDVRRDVDASFQGTPEDRIRGCQRLFSLGLLYHRLKRFGDAIQAYQERLRIIAEFRIDKVRDGRVETTLYNLACEYSLSGDRDKAVEWLEKSIRSGYKDRDWMKKDRDLDPIRGEARFRQLMADDRLFEKMAPEGPQRGAEVPPADK